MKPHTPAQLEDVGLIIGRLPRLGELGREPHAVVEIEQAVEDQVMRARRHGVGRVARVEAVHGGVHRDRDDAGLGLGLRTADGQSRQRYSAQTPAGVARSDFRPRSLAKAGASDPVSGHSSSFFNSASSNSACIGVRLSVSVPRRRCASFSAAGSADAI